MNRKRSFILLNHLVNKNHKLVQKLLQSDQELLQIIEIREMRQGLKYCNINHNLMIDMVLKGDEKAIKKHLRLSKLAVDKLVELSSTKHHGYSANIEIGVMLFWLACGTSYRVVSAAFDIPTISVFYIVQRIIKLLLKLIKKTIFFPDLDQYSIVGAKFGNRAGSSALNKAVGAIDGTHIKIKCPMDRHDEYINRKLDYSIQLQAVCDAEHKFLDIYVGWPESVHDQRVLRNSDIYLKKSYPADGYFLLGDSGYKLSLEAIAIITPYIDRGSLDQRQKKFNYLHSKGRIAVEQAFGQMKTRWRCIFLRALELKVKHCVKVIAICCVLHNICKDVGDLISIDEEFEIEEEVSTNFTEHNPQRNATEFRDQLCAEI